MARMLSEAVRELAECPEDDPVLLAGVRASAGTLNVGVHQNTRAAANAELIRKHRGRLRAALRAMAHELAREERADA